MYKVVLLRHGESEWNRENRFTGWTDVPLSEKGLTEAQSAGKTLKDKGFVFDKAYTSVLKRAIKTLWCVLEEMDLMWIPVENSWKLNERHYGALSGLNKEAVKREVGEQQLHAWRRGFFAVPPQLAHPAHDRRYDRLGVKEPLAESLEMCLERILPYWQDQVAPRLLAGHDQLIVAHGSTLRALVKYIEGISDDQIDQVEVLNGQPIIYQFDDHLVPVHKEILMEE